MEEEEELTTHLITIGLSGDSRSRFDVDREPLAVAGRLFELEDPNQGIADRRLRRWIVRARERPQERGTRHDVRVGTCRTGWSCGALRPCRTLRAGGAGFTLWPSRSWGARLSLVTLWSRRTLRPRWSLRARRARRTGLTNRGDR